MEDSDVKKEHPIEVLEDDPEIRPKMNTQSSIQPDDQNCQKCPQLEQTLESALTMIQDLLIK